MKPSIHQVRNNKRYGTVAPKCNVALARMSTIACDKKSHQKVDMVPVSITSLHSIIGGVKI